MQKNQITVYISLGSNMGDRLLFLQKAVDQIYNKIGDVKAISKVYQTPSWGFESEDFYNACIQVTTTVDTEQALQELLQIESELGRYRTEKQGYAARTIDLDIVFSSEGVIDKKHLQVPHPVMQNRKFVLLPLVTIAPDFIHPVLEKTVAQLLEETEDVSVVQEVEKELCNPKNSLNLSQFQYVTIEGNIGAGKTSLATQISTEFNAKLVLEQFADNPFLPKFYDDMERYAFPLEMSFLADRYQRLQDDIGQFDLFKDFVVSDYDVFKSRIFASVTLQEEEYELYKKVFDMLYKSLPKPGLYIYLYQNTERLLANIKKRGREYEQQIKADYLNQINQGYMQFIKSQPNLSVKIIDVSEKDFVSNRQDYLWVLHQILGIS